MRRVTLSALVAATALGGCQQSPPAKDQKEAERSRPEAYKAVIRCRINGMSMMAGMCFLRPGRGELGGLLKVSSRGRVRQYESSDFLTSPFNRDTASLKLEPPFELTVQANSDPVVLRVEIKDGATTVYQDEVGSLGGTVITDDMLEKE
jgi:hypothetical protein